MATLRTKRTNKRQRRLPLPIRVVVSLGVAASVAGGMLTTSANPVEAAEKTCNTISTRPVRAQAAGVKRVFVPTRGNSASCVLKVGDRGYEVTTIQKAINCHGIRVTEDGIFGTQTRDNVKLLQGLYDLDQTGVWNRDLTLKTLFRARGGPCFRLRSGY